MKVLGIDPGFKYLGLALLDWIPGEGTELLDVQVFQTEKSAKKHNVKTTCDNTRRLKEIGRWIAGILGAHKIVAAGIEAYSAPRNASVAGQLGLGWGGIVTLLDQDDIPVYEFTPQEVKTKLGLAKTASKEQVIEVVEKTWPSFDGWPRAAKKRTILDHGADAAAIALLTTRQPELSAVMRILGR